MRTNKTKEELAELRKQMMKYQPKGGSSICPSKTDDQSYGQSIMGEKRLTTIKPSQLAWETDSKVNNDLLLRLASGNKPAIDKKEMKKLTTKNYQNLPEIKKKKEDEKMKKEIAAKRER